MQKTASGDQFALLGPHDLAKASSSVFSAVYPMYYVPIADFMDLRRLMPHQEMQAKGLVKQWTPAMRGKIIGVSHQWLAYMEADPDGHHLRALQSLLGRLLCGRSTRMEDFWLHKLLFQTKSVQTSGKAWKATLLSAGIWIDYCCMPQILHMKEISPASSNSDDGSARAANLDSEGSARAAAQAMCSLPCYMERCSFLVVVAPACTHKDSGEACDFATWRRRGWCRLELNLTLLAAAEIRAMVITGEDAEPFLLHPFDGPKLQPGEGDFTCCKLNHVLPNGKHIGCDRGKVRKTLELMLTSKVLRLHREGRFIDARFFACLRGRYLAGLPASGPSAQSSLGTICHFKLRESLRQECELQSSSGRGAEALRKRLKWGPEDDERAKSTGFSLLMCAAIADDALAVTELVRAKADPSQGLQKNFFHLTYMVQGNTPIFAAMAYGTFETVQALLDSNRVDPKYVNSMGMDALMAACCKGTEDNVKAWLGHFPTWNVDRTIPMMAMPAAGICCLTGANKGPLVRSIIECGGSVRSPKYWGGNGTLLCIAANNADCDKDLVATLLEFRADPNEAWQSPAMAWRGVFFGLRHRGCIKNHSQILKELASMQGSTPLHFAAKRHDMPVVELLLRARAESRPNAQGLTPLDLARSFNGGRAPAELEKMLQGSVPSLPQLLSSKAPRADSKAEKEHSPRRAESEEAEESETIEVSV